MRAALHALLHHQAARNRPRAWPLCNRLSPITRAPSPSKAPRAAAQRLSLRCRGPPRMNLDSCDPGPNARDPGTRFLAGLRGRRITHEREGKHSHRRRRGQHAGLAGARLSPGRARGGGVRQRGARAGTGAHAALRSDPERRGDAAARRTGAARRLEDCGRGRAGGDDERPGAHRDGGARHAAGGAGFSREAALDGEAAGHGRERAQVDAPGNREPRPARARGQAHAGLRREKPCAA